ncbi:MAG TPA: hypothetical protein VFS21_22195 [Roseiflexaceae bacterium]|nr:hypothetical protein [Roseiflexaceae bacterium]
MLEPKTHSFIVKVWLDEIGDDGRAVWRGHITHVATGSRRSFDRLATIVCVIAPYLASLGVQMALGDRLCGWVGRRRGRQTER